MKKEALYFGLDDVMFPAPPPVPVAPFTLKDTEGNTWNITQTADGIYYGEYSSVKKSIMTICTGCNKGFVDWGTNIDCYKYKFANFAVGRDFVPGQPQRSVCTDKCTEDAEYTIL